MDAWLEPVTLEGDVVRLEPMMLDHVDGLTAVVDPSVFTWMLVAPTDRDGVRAYVDAALANRDAGLEVPWVTVERASGRPIGSTRFLTIAPEHRRLEIGWTWIAPAWQRSAVNSEAKLLQLERAFDVLGARRVEFKTDARNERSRAALLGIGATFEGILRAHMVTRDDGRRDSAYYSILDHEWPAVRKRLRTRLGRAG
ncbi:MAG TPA: GNAT family N-acetyltransferase [Candidatus Limnocylindrales bacterium]|jgi:RimJ/RimL family protein N-acetyltransferase